MLCWNFFFLIKKIVIDKTIFFKKTLLDYKKIIVPEEIFCQLTFKSLNGEFFSSVTPFASYFSYVDLWFRIGFSEYEYGSTKPLALNTDSIWIRIHITDSIKCFLEPDDLS